MDHNLRCTRKTPEMLETAEPFSGHNWTELCVHAYTWGGRVFVYSQQDQ